MRRASSRPIASPRPKPPLEPAAAPRWKRSKMRSRSSAGMPGALVGDRDRGVDAAHVRLDPHRRAARAVAQRVVEQDPHDARDGVRVAAAPARPSGRSPSIDVERSRARSSNSATTARTISPSSTGSERSGTAASSRERSSSSPESADSRSSSRARDRDLAQRVELVEPARADVLLEQLHRALEHRQRRAQLVRGGRDERAPRGLLAAQLLLHARQRAREVADLVAALVARRRRVGALARDPQRDGAQAPEPAQQRRGERDRQQRRDRQADDGGDQEARLHLLDERGRLGQLALGHAARRSAARPSLKSGAATTTLSPSTLRHRPRRSASPRSASSTARGGSAANSLS